MKKIIILLLFSTSAFAGSLGNYGYEGCGYYRGNFGRVFYVCPDGRSGQRVFGQNLPDMTPSNPPSNSIGRFYIQPRPNTTSPNERFQYKPYIH